MADISTLLILLLDQPPCPNVIRIVGRWCSTSCTWTKETLDFVPYYLIAVLCISLFFRTSPGLFISSSRHFPSPSTSTTTAAASRALDLSIPACSQNHIPTRAPGALSNPSHRYNSDRVEIYCATVFWRCLTYYSIFRKPATSLDAAPEVCFHFPYVALRGSCSVSPLFT